MKLKLSLLLICVFGLQSLSQAQGRFQFSDLYFFGGGNLTMTSPLSSSDANRLERNLFSQVGLSPDKYYKGDWENRIRLSSQIGMMAGWNIRGSRIGNQKIRLGFSAGNYQINWNNSYQAKDVYRIDTLVSQQTGKEIYVDSTRIRTLDYEHSAQMFNLHFDYLLYLNPRNRLTFYTGAGAQFGISLSNTVTSNYYEHDENDKGNRDYNDYKNDKDDYYQLNKRNYNFNSENKALSPTTNLNAYALVGLNLRLSKRNRFLKHMHLFHEWRLGLQLNQMENIDPSIGINAGVQTGLRVSFNNRSAKPNKKKTRRKRY